MTSLNRKLPQRSDPDQHSPSRKNPKNETYRSTSEKSRSISWTDLPRSPTAFRNKVNRQHMHNEDGDLGSAGSVPVSEDGSNDWQSVVHAACGRIWAATFNNVQQANRQIVQNVKEEQTKVFRQVLKHLDHILKVKMKKLADEVQNWTEGQLAAMLREEEDIQTTAVDEILNLAYDITHKRSEAARYEERKKASDETQRIQRDTEKQMQRVVKEVTRSKEEAMSDISKRMHQDVKDATTEIQQAREELSEKQNAYQKEIDRLEEKIEELDTEIRLLHKKCRDLTTRKEQTEKEIEDIQTQLKQFLDLAFKASDHGSLGQMSHS